MSERELKPDLYVLDAIADDVEDLATIMRTLNSDTAIGWHRAWGRHFDRIEVVAALSRLIRAGLVRVALLSTDGKELVELPLKGLPPADYDDAWYAMTPAGRLVHTNWHPEVAKDVME